MRKLLDQIFKRPLAALISSMEMLGQKVEGRQRIDGIVSRIAHTLNRVPGQSALKIKTTVTVIENAHGELAENTRQGESEQVGKDLSARTQSRHQLNDRSPTVVAEDANRILKPTGKRRDTNLSDEMLKLVRYGIVFVKRDYEVAFPEKEELVSDNLRENAYTAWKIAEFIQGLDQTKIPKNWREKNYPRNEGGCGPMEMIHSLPEEDKKYLRVSFEVRERYPRRAARYKKRQLSALGGVRDAIERLRK